MALRLNYVEARDGRRVVRWGNLLAFFVGALALPALSAGAASWFLWGDFRYAWLAAVIGLLIFAGALGLSLRTPLERLPQAR